MVVADGKLYVVNARAGAGAPVPFSMIAAAYSTSSALNVLPVSRGSPLMPAGVDDEVCCRKNAASAFGADAALPYASPRKRWKCQPEPYTVYGALGAAYT